MATGFVPPSWRSVSGKSQCHCGATGRLADDEPPPGHEARPLAEALPTINVGPARRRILSSELRR